MEYDVVVAGGGAAGLSAALTLARAGRRLAVVDKGEPRNAPAAHLHGFLSRDGMSPADLLDAGRAEVAGYGGELITDGVAGLERASSDGVAGVERASDGVAGVERASDGVAGVERAGPGFVARLDGGRRLAARAVLVATGLRDVLPEAPGVRELWGTDVLHCPYCHGHEVRDAPIGVLGGDNRPFSVHQASLVRQWSADVVVFPHTIELSGEERERLLARGTRIVDGPVAELIVQSGRLTGVRMADDRIVARSAVFVGPRFVPRDELLTGLGCEVGSSGWVAADASGRTSVPGVWAAGNVVSEPAQLAPAIGMGMTTAIAINHYLLAQDIDRAVARHRATGPR